ncbi:MAG: carboxylating nicotinate-nucleotide diphosphorylase [Acidobacteria bacterium]|nr:carboxylating nicotinate-nucleotide diphosphorylase [Acidobacteriota bacterium]
MKSEPFGPLDPALYRDTVRRAIAEDLGWGDLTTEATVPDDLRARGRLVAKSACVLAGLEVAAEVFRQLDPGATIESRCRDGDRLEPGDVLAEITGYATRLLTAERTALNFLQHLSGIATLTRAFVDAAAGRITVLDTRKTLPTLRVLEKYAVRAGGGVNHRMALDDGLLIKDNHVRLAGGVAAALERMRAAGHEMRIEIEAQTLAQLDEALAAGAAMILVDNMSIEEIREAVRRARGSAVLEISGGVTLARIPDLAATGAEYVSVGALTHSAAASDISFELEPIESPRDG